MQDTFLDILKVIQPAVLKVALITSQNWSLKSVQGDMLHPGKEEMSCNYGFVSA